MPEVHFIGAIEHVSGAGMCDEELCVTWALIPGNEEWYIQKGSFFGETQISSVAVDGKAILNHPLDVQFNTESSEGWPRLVCELWRRDSIFSAPPLPALLGGGGTQHSGSGIGDGDAGRGFLGCGCAWLPPPSGSQQTLTVHLWRPAPSSGGILAVSSVRTLADHLLPPIPDMERLREIAINPGVRATAHTHPAGEVMVSLHTLVTKDFRSFGVHL